MMSSKFKKFSPGQSRNYVKSSSEDERPKKLTLFQQAALDRQKDSLKQLVDLGIHEAPYMQAMFTLGAEAIKQIFLQGKLPKHVRPLVAFFAKENNIDIDLDPEMDEYVKYGKPLQIHAELWKLPWGDDNRLELIKAMVKKGHPEPICILESADKCFIFKADPIGWLGFVAQFLDRRFIVHTDVFPSHKPSDLNTSAKSTQHLLLHGGQLDRIWIMENHYRLANKYFNYDISNIIQVNYFNYRRDLENRKIVQQKSKSVLKVVKEKTSKVIQLSPLIKDQKLKKKTLEKIVITDDSISESSRSDVNTIVSTKSAVAPPPTCDINDISIVRKSQRSLLVYLKPKMGDTKQKKFKVSKEVLDQFIQTLGIRHKDFLYLCGAIFQCCQHPGQKMRYSELILHDSQHGCQGLVNPQIVSQIWLEPKYRIPISNLPDKASGIKNSHSLSPPKQGLVKKRRK